jgi:hypothetical protein
MNFKTFFKQRWDIDVTCAIHKANRSLNDIKLIRKYFNNKELLTMTTSNFYSVLFYNAEIWLTTYLNDNVKNKNFKASANAFKMCHYSPNQMTSFLELHKTTGRATPMLISDNKCAP